MNVSVDVMLWRLLSILATDAILGLSGILKALMEIQNAGLTPDSLVKEAAQGHHDNVRSILARNPSYVSVMWSKKTFWNVITETF